MFSKFFAKTAPVTAITVGDTCTYFKGEHVKASGVVTEVLQNGNIIVEVAKESVIAEFTTSKVLVGNKLMARVGQERNIMGEVVSFK